MRIIYFLIPFLVLSSVVFSETTPTTTATPTSAQPPIESLPAEFREIEEEQRNNGDAFTSGLFKMLATLAMMVGLIYIISYMLRKAMSKNQTKINETSGIKILESRSLNQRTAIYLIEVRGKEYVIAESPHGATLLADTSRTTKQ